MNTSGDPAASGNHKIATHHIVKYDRTTRLVDEFKYLSVLNLVTVDSHQLNRTEVLSHGSSSGEVKSNPDVLVASQR